MPFLTVPDVLALPAAPPDFEIAYGRDPAQFAELRLPEGPGPHRVAIVIHGGCWLSDYDLGATCAMADALRRAGCATWHLEYRRLGMPGGGWPGTFLDVARGVDHLRQVAAVHRLDLGRTVVIGHSAGGHLALWAAARHRVPARSPLWTADPLRPAGAVSLGGIVDLQGFLGLQDASCGGPVVRRLLGGLPEEVPERYRAASPIEMLPVGVPQVLITGADDPIVPPRIGSAYAAAARASGDTVSEIVVDDAAHFEVIAPGSVAWAVVEREVTNIATDDSGSRRPRSR